MKEVKKESKTKKTVAKATASKTTKASETKKEVKVTKKKTTETKEKKQTVLLNEREQKCYTVLCNVIKLVAKICRVCLMIFIPFIIVSMVFIPIIFRKFEVSANILKFDNMSIIIQEDGISAKIGDTVHSIECNTFEIDRVMTFLTNNNKTSIIVRFELAFLVLSVVVILSIILLNYIEELFGNFVKQKTPFTEENTEYMFRIAIYTLGVKAACFCFSIVGLFSRCFISINVISVLILFAVCLIFKYATSMQKIANTKICE